MTNEEAVKWLRAYPKMTDFTMPQIEEALDMAEKALMEQAQADGEKSFKMRDATPEEQEAIDKYIKSISKPTGVNVFDFYEDEEQEELDFVQPHKTIPCKVKVQTCDEYVRKSDVLDALEISYLKSEIDDDTYQRIRDMPSVAIPNKVGHWVYNQYDGNPNIGNWHCSECRNIVSDMPTCMGKPLYEFCPHCGSPMEIER